MKVAHGPPFVVQKILAGGTGSRWRCPAEILVLLISPQPSQRSKQPKWALVLLSKPKFPTTLMKMAQGPPFVAELFWQVAVVTGEGT